MRLQLRHPRGPRRWPHAIGDLAAGLRLLVAAPGFLRRPLTDAEIRPTIRGRLARREADFLALVREAVYGVPASPYRRLLAHAGCEPGDLARLVAQEGVDGALRALLRGGVYLTVEEFKGRRPIVRGPAVIPSDPAAFRNPLAAPALLTRSGGSRGGRTPVALDLAFARDGGVNMCAAVAAHGGRDWQHGIWEIPGSGALVHVLECTAFGRMPVRWFSQVAPDAPGLPQRYRWSARVLRWAGMLAGRRVPRPEHVRLEEPQPIARWMAATLRSGAVPNLYTFPSSAVRVCQAALEAGLDLRGGRFSVTGEPITPARVAAVQRAGAAVVAGYGSMECGGVAKGCLAPVAPDDLHVYHDLHALIQPGPAAPPGLPPDALLISSLRRTAPFLMLNVSMGDAGILAERGCGCPMEAVGWVTHLHSIRSFEKLTAGGMTFLDTEVIRVLEEALPARFGGTPTDYQLVEHEEPDGAPHVRLLVHPRVGPVDAAALGEAFLQEIAVRSPAGAVMALAWRDAVVLQVERRPPRATPVGKILHLHVVSASGPARTRYSRPD